MEKILIIGAGGHAHSVIEVLLEQGQHYEIAGIVDQQYGKIGSLYGIPLIGDMSAVPAIFQSGVRNAIIASGSNSIRKKISVDFKQFNFPAIISKKAIIGYSVSIDDGSIIMPGVCLRINASIGQHCIVNTNVCIDHECKVGNFVHIAPGCAISGRVSIDDGVFLGTGTSVIDKLRIGQWSTVGAGGVVINDLSPHLLAVGVPTRVIRTNINMEES
jgi:sugar O-acyltransferase (sialic acid O-acetyltransferase NeuD family)